MFSVIIPLFNKADTIERALKSVQTQSLKDFEIIVVDDGSTDEGNKVVHDYAIQDSRIHLLQQENKGVSAARNAGIKVANNDYIVFLDADDEYLPNYLETIKKLINKYPQCGIWAARYFYESEGRLTPVKIYGLANDFEGIIDNYFEIASKSEPPIWTGAVCCSKKALFESNCFPEGIKSGEDLLTWARICVRYKLAYSSIPIAIFHLVPEHFIQIGNTRRKTEMHDKVGEGLIALLPVVNDNWKESLRHYISQWYKMRACVFFRNRMCMQTLHSMIKCLMYNPANFRVFVYGVGVILPQFLINIFIKVIFSRHNKIQ